MREASVHMSRAENIKAALAPPIPPGPRFASGGGGSEVAGAGKGRGKARGGSGQGKTALSRPVPTGSDVTGSIRVSGGGGVPWCCLVGHGNGVRARLVRGARADAFCKVIAPTV